MSRRKRLAACAAVASVALPLAGWTLQATAAAQGSTASPLDTTPYTCAASSPVQSVRHSTALNTERIVVRVSPIVAMRVNAGGNVVAAMSTTGHAPCADDRIVVLRDGQQTRPATAGELAALANATRSLNWAPAGTWHNVEVAPH